MNVDMMNTSDPCAIDYIEEAIRNVRSARFVTSHEPFSHMRVELAEALRILELALILAKDVAP